MKATDTGPQIEDGLAEGLGPLPAHWDSALALRMAVEGSPSRTLLLIAWRLSNAGVPDAEIVDGLTAGASNAARRILTRLTGLESEDG